jgi:hypothetical protein
MDGLEAVQVCNVGFKRRRTDNRTIPLMETVDIMNPFPG